MPYIPLGTYKISVSAPGFKTAVAENVQLRVGQTLTVNFKLELGQVTENITVTQRRLSSKRERQRLDAM